MTSDDFAVLDDPVGESLRGRHACLARRLGGAATYLPDVATFAAVGVDPGLEQWDELARLLGRGELADMFSCAAPPPVEWEPVFFLEGRQMIWPAGAHPAHPPRDWARGELVELGAESVPEMLDLVERTAPGPFWSRTHEMGTYLGVRDNGALVAMAGERLRPPGWTEISAICTAPEARGRGHAARLIRALIAHIVARGDRPFLHVAETNSGAIALYERLGFQHRKYLSFQGFRIP